MTTKANQNRKYITRRDVRTESPNVYVHVFINVHDVSCVKWNAKTEIHAMEKKWIGVFNSNSIWERETERKNRTPKSVWTERFCWFSVLSGTQQKKSENNCDKLDTPLIEYWMCWHKPNWKTSGLKEETFSFISYCFVSFCFVRWFFRPKLIIIYWVKCIHFLSRCIRCVSELTTKRQVRAQFFNWTDFNQTKEDIKMVIIDIVQWNYPL